MKGYKATSNMKSNMYSHTYTYEVGKTYEIDLIKLDRYGFRFFPKMNDIVHYCNHYENLVLLEVEVLGDIEKLEKQSVTNKIKILRIVPKEEYTFELPYDNSVIKEYDSNGNVIYYKTINGDEGWKEYDSNEKLKHFKNSDGYEYWCEHDSNGYLTGFKRADGFGWSKKYDSNGNVIHHKFSNGVERSYENKYDSNGNLIYTIDSNKTEHWYEYDSFGNIIHFRRSDGFEEWQEFDSNNNRIHWKTCDGDKTDEEWMKYDSNNNVVYYKDSEGVEWTVTITE